MGDYGSSDMGSNPVGTTEMGNWPRGEARDCKSRYIGSNPILPSKRKRTYEINRKRSIIFLTFI